VRIYQISNLFQQNILWTGSMALWTGDAAGSTVDQ
jgi:hypothetical protein